MLNMELFISQNVLEKGKFTECCMAPVRLATTFRQGTIFADIAINPSAKKYFFLILLCSAIDSFITFFSFLFDTFIYSFKILLTPFSLLSANWFYCYVWKLIRMSLRSELILMHIYYISCPLILWNVIHSLTIRKEFQNI